MQIRVGLLLLSTALTLPACENTNLTQSGPPTLRFRSAQLIQESEGAAMYEVKRGTTDTFVTDPPGVTISGVAALANPQVVTAKIPTSTTLEVTCHDKLGKGTFNVDLKEPDGRITSFELKIECVHRITIPKNQPVNLTEFFAGAGLIPVAASAAPNDLAEQIVIEAAILASEAALRGASTVSADGADVGVRCLREGDGILTVTFESGSNDYNLRCGTEHDQGGGG
jgi:hypothetical protein